MNMSFKEAEVLIYTDRGIIIRKLSHDKLGELVGKRTSVTLHPYGTYYFSELENMTYVPLLSKSGGLIFIDARIFEDVAEMEAVIADEERVRKRMGKPFYVEESGGPLGELYSMAKANSEEFIRYVFSRKRELGMRVG
jgi:hypothetical protein